MAVGGVDDYLHSDMIGTLHMTTIGSGPQAGTPGLDRVFTAFGRRISGTANRYGYAGAWGYQSTLDESGPTPTELFPFTHVGARYYDPSTGRFLQRDPIGIMGSLNVYAYAENQPASAADPDGLSSVHIGVATGVISAKEAAELLGLAVGTGVAGKLAEEAAKKAINVARKMARDKAAKQAERAQKEAQRQYRTNKKFKRWLHRDYKPKTKGDGNPDLTPEEMRDAWELFSGCQ